METTRSGIYTPESWTKRVESGEGSVDGGNRRDSEGEDEFRERNEEQLKPKLR